jgi:Flp pilus assembly pilin Flp
MIELLNYFKVRYLGERGQGIVEYALILAFVVGIAAYLTNAAGLGTAVSTTISKAASTLSHS